MIVCANQYRTGKDQIKSMYHGFPLINTRELLGSIVVPVDSESLTVDESENYFVFETGFSVPFPVVKSGGGGGDDVEGAATDGAADEGAAGVDE